MWIRQSSAGLLCWGLRGVSRKPEKHDFTATLLFIPLAIGSNPIIVIIGDGVQKFS